MVENKKINRLKVVLAEKDISSKALAEGLGMARSTVSMWINNKKQPSIETFIRIADYLDVDVRELINPTKIPAK